MRTPGPISLSLLQRHHFADKGPSSQSYVFPVVMYGCESWTIKKAECQRIDGFRTVVLEKTPAPETGHQGDQTPLLTPKGNQPWTLIGKTVAEAEAPILWPPDVKSRLIRKDPDAGKDWRLEEKGMTEDEMEDGITDSMDKNFSKLWEIVEDREVWPVIVHGVAKSWTQLSDWTTMTTLLLKIIFLVYYLVLCSVVSSLFQHQQKESRNLVFLACCYNSLN